MTSPRRFKRTLASLMLIVVIAVTYVNFTYEESPQYYGEHIRKISPSTDVAAHRLTKQLERRKLMGQERFFVGGSRNPITPTGRASWSKPSSVASTSPGRLTTISQVVHYNTSLFVDVLGARNKAILMNTVRQLVEVCAQLNISYMMYGGTLLGSWRHHDLIPWDDDLDVFIKNDDKDELYSALSMKTSDYVVELAGPRIKFFSRFAKKTSVYPWSWPYVDISFYDENSTHIWDSSIQFRNYIYPKSIVFPLHLRPLGELNLSAPQDSHAFIKFSFYKYYCSVSPYSHRVETKVLPAQVIVPCKELRSGVGFVHRTLCSNGKLCETLKVGDVIKRTVMVDDPPYAISDPYTLKLNTNT